MASGYSVTVKGLDELKRRFASAPGVIGKEMHTAMLQSVIYLEGNIKPLAPVDTGALRASISHEIRGAGANIQGVVGSSLKGEVYPAVMEFGSKQRTPPSHKLQRWVQRKMGVSQEESAKVAFRVARAIGRKGIKGRFYMKKGFEASKAGIVRYFEAAVGRVVKALGG